MATIITMMPVRDGLGLKKLKIQLEIQAHHVKPNKSLFWTAPKWAAHPASPAPTITDRACTLKGKHWGSNRQKKCLLFSKGIKISEGGGSG